MFKTGLRVLLAQQPGVKLVGEATDAQGQAALAWFKWALALGLTSTSMVATT